MKITSEQTRRPLLDASHISAWYMGTVDVSMPVPMPQMNRPIIRCARLKHDVCNAAPTWTHFSIYSSTRKRL